MAGTSPALRGYACLRPSNGKGLQRHPAVDEMGLAGNVARFVAGKEEGKGSDLLRLAKPAHRLAIDKSLAYFIAGRSRRLRLGGDTLLERRGFDRAGTDRIAADALLDEIGGDRFGQSDYRGLGRAISIAIGHAADRGHRGGNIDDRAGSFRQHSRQKRLDHAVHRLDIQIKGKVPILLRAVEHRAIGDIAGAIYQNIERAELAE